MPMGADVMNKATPVRLFRTDGRWVLEVEGLQRLKRDLFRPQRDTIEGEDRILMQLGKRQETTTLGSEAAEIMKTLVEADNDVCFDNHDGTWLEGDDSADSPLMLGPGGQSLAERVESLEKENRELKERLAKLEESVANGAVAAPPAGDASSANAEPTDEEAAALAAASDDVAPEPDVGAAAEPPGHEELAELDEAPASDGTWSGPQIQLPPYSELYSVLGSLVDGTQPSEAAMPLELGPEVIDVYGCNVTDDSGEVVAVLLANVSAVAQCGGRMAGVSAEDIEEAEADEMASDEMVEGTEQIFNVVMSKINEIPDNPKLEVGNVGLFDFERHPWVCESEAKREIADGLGGQFVLVARTP